MTGVDDARILIHGEEVPVLQRRIDFGQAGLYGGRIQPHVEKSDTYM